MIHPLQQSTLPAGRLANRRNLPGAGILQLVVLLALMAFPALANAQSQNALAFDGVNDYVSTPGTLIASGSSYTREAWVYKRVGSNNTCNIISSSGNPFWISSGKLSAGHNSSYTQVQATATFTEGVWTHVACTYDRPTNSLKLYVNGIKVGDITNASVYTGNQILIGAHIGDVTWPGMIDEVRIWNRALCQAEIQNNMNGELPNPATQNGLVAYYKFNQGVAADNNTGITTLTSAIGSSTNGTLLNFNLTAGNTTSNFASGAPAITGDASPFVISTLPTPVITTPGNVTSYCSGSTLTLSTTAVAGYAYQWKRGGTNISGATSNTYTTNQQGNFVVTVTDNCGATATSENLNLTYIGPPVPLVTTPGDVTSICTGGSLVLSTVAVSGYTYQWKKGGTNISGATLNTYTATTTGNYSVTATGAVSGCTGSSTSAATSISTTVAPSVPVVTTVNNVTSFCAGDTLTLSTPAVPGYSYSWRNNGSYIPGSTSNSLNVTSGGNYTVTVSNCAGSQISAGKSISVTGAPATPVITVAGGIYNFCSGDSLVMSTPAVAGCTYQWKRGTNTISGATSNTYTATLGGNYTVVATNCGGATTSGTAGLTITGVPATPPTSTPGGATTVCPNDSLMIATPLVAGYTYQWRRGGTPIPGATSNTYAIIMAGTYRVSVTNCTGTTNSAQTVVTVIGAPSVPVITTPGGATSFCQGSSLALSTPAVAGYTYQWNKDSVAVSGATGNSFSATTEGSYTVTVTNCAGAATSEAFALTTNPLPTGSISGDATTCAGAVTNLTFSSPTGTTFTYSNGSTTSGPVSFNGGTTTVPVAPTTTTTYSIVSISDGTCSSSAPGSALVSVNAKPVISGQPATAAQAICQDGTITPLSVSATASSGTLTSYEWYSNTLNSNTGGTLVATHTSNAATDSYTPSASVTSSLYYYVVVTNDNGCSSVSNVSGLITVNAQPSVPTTVVTNPSSSCGNPWFCLSAVLADPGMVYWYTTPTGGSSIGTSGSGSCFYYSATGNGIYYAEARTSAGCVSVSRSSTSFTYYDPVVITSEPAAITACQSDVATLSVAANAGSAAVTKYEWYSNSTNSNTGGNLEATHNVNASSDTYSPSTGTAGNKYYYAVATSENGCSKSSTAAYVVVNAVPTVSYSAVPYPSTLCMGAATSPATVNATAGSGTITSYKWYRYPPNGASTLIATHNTSASSDSYTPPTDTAGAWYYYPVITNSNGCSKSSPNTTPLFTVYGGVKIIGNIQPLSLDLCQNSTRKLSVSASATNANITRYDWYRSLTSGSLGTLVATHNTSATTDSCTILTDVPGVTYYYRAVVSTADGCTATSGESQVYVFDPVVITGHPSTKAQYICQGGTGMTLSASATVARGGISTYKWYRDTVNSNTGGMLVSTSSTYSTYTPDGNILGGTYYYAVATSMYGCTAATNPSGLITVDLPVTPTAVTATPSVVCPGASTNLNAASAGNWINWYTTAAGGTSIGTSTSGSDFNVTPDSNVTYYAQAVSMGTGPYNMLGNVNSTGSSYTSATCGYLFVPNKNITITGVRSMWGSKITVWNGGNMVFSKKLSGLVGAWDTTYLQTPVVLYAGTSYIIGALTADTPNNSYSLYNNNLPSSFADGTIYSSYYAAGDRNPGGLNPGNVNYLIDLIYRTETGCTSGVRTSVPVTRFMEITGQPAKTAQTVCQNSPLTTLSVSASSNGTTISKYEWYRNTTNSTTGGTLFATHTTSAVTDTCTPPAGSAGKWYYYAVVTTANGCSMKSATSGLIMVYAKPVITGQPATAAQTVCRNGYGTNNSVPNPISVSATAGGDTIASYKWYSNTANSNVGGTLIATHLTSSGSDTYTPTNGTNSALYYYAVVTTVNGCSVTSNPSGLITVRSLTITSQPSAATQTLCQNSTGIPLSVSVDDTSTAKTYKWTLEGYGITINHASTAANDTCMPRTDDARGNYYSVLITDAYGCTVFSNYSGTIIVRPTLNVASQPSASAQTICQNSTTGTLSVNMNNNGLAGLASSYQWYSNTVNSNTGGTLVATHNSANYSDALALPSAATGSQYYYAVFTTVHGCTTKSNVSGAVTVVPLPGITSQPSAVGQAICQDGTATALSVSATGGGAAISKYEWYRNNTNNNNGGTLVSTNSTSATTHSYVPPTGTVGNLYNYAVVTNSNGCTVKSDVSGLITVSPLPVISNQPLAAGQTICQYSTATELWLFVQDNGAAISKYEWYSNTVNSNSGGTLIATYMSGANSNTYAPATTTAGTLYYYVVITNVNSCSVRSNTSRVTVTASPNITVPANISVSTATNQCTATVPYSTTATGSPTPTVTYAFTGATQRTGSGNGSGSVFNKGVTTVTITATSSCVATKSFTVTVTDNQFPTITPPANKTVNASCVAVPAAQVALGTPVVADNCGTPTVTNNAPASYQLGVNTVTWTVTDSNNNSTTATQTVTVVNTTPAPTAVSATPATVCPGTAASLSAASAGNTIVWYTTATGGTSIGSSASGAGFSVTPAANTTYYAEVLTTAGGCPSASRTSVTVSRYDSVRITSQPSASQTVCQNSTPVLSVSASASSTAISKYEWYRNATNSNNGGTLVATHTVAAATDTLMPATAAAGTLYYYAVVTTVNGCTAKTATAGITVNPLPAVTVPANIGVNTAANQCTATVPYTALATGTPAPALTYAFTGATTGSGNGTGAGSVFNKGVTTVTVTGTNSCTASQSFTVTVTDNQRPTITAPAAKTINGWCVVPYADAAIGSPVVADNCTTIVTNDAPANFLAGNTTVTWTVSDGTSIATATQIVKVVPATVTAAATVTPAYPMAGQELQTIYLNYPGTVQSETIGLTGSGGTGIYTYSWAKSGCSNTTMSAISGATAASYVYSPTIADACNGANDNTYIFTGTVTDSHGCAASQSKKINVVNPYLADGTVQVCHKVTVRGATPTAQTVAVPASQVATHLGHGDAIGNCVTFTAAKGELPKAAPAQEANVYPNPTTGMFILDLSVVTDKAYIVISDLSGRTITTRTIGKEEVPTATFDLSNYSKGVYLIQVKDAEFMYRAKVVVQ